MIVQLINNASWASLLVNESKTWQRETSNTIKKSNSKYRFSNVNDSIKTVQVVTQLTGANDV